MNLVTAADFFLNFVSLRSQPRPITSSHSAEWPPAPRGVTDTASPVCHPTCADVFSVSQSTQSVSQSTQCTTLGLASGPVPAPFEPPQEPADAPPSGAFQARELGGRWTPPISVGAHK